MNPRNRCLAIVFTVVALTYTGVLQAQEQRIRTDEQVVQLEELATEEIQYLFTADRKGSYFWNNREETGLFNFNVLFGLFQYTDIRGYPKWLAPADVDSVRIGKTLFLPYGEGGFFQVVPEAEELLIRHLVDIDTETRVRGAYGTTDETASIEVLHTLTKGREGRSTTNHHAMLENPGGQELHINLKRKQHFYLLNDGEPVAAHNRRALQRAFPDHSRPIRRFIRREDIDFDRAEDLMQVLDYVNSL